MESTWRRRIKTKAEKVLSQGEMQKTSVVSREISDG